MAHAAPAELLPISRMAVSAADGVHRRKPAMSRDVPDVLFIYGTLLPHLGYPAGSRLAREATRVGEATVKGLLFDLGGYPAFIARGPEGGDVYGELYLLHDPKVSLAWLDAYEDAAETSTAEYRRAVIAATRNPSGEQVSAWIYLYNRPVGGATLIQSGRWEKPCPKDDLHARLRPR